MTTIIEGMTPAQFITAMNNNFAVIKYESTVIDTISTTSGITDINSNFTSIESETYTPQSPTSLVAGISGTGFANIINSNNAKYINPSMTLTVGTGKNFTTITGAITRASDDNTLIIDTGTYDEAIDLTAKKLNLIGSGTLETILYYTAIIGNTDSTFNIGTDSTFTNLLIRKHNDNFAANQAEIVIINGCSPTFINCEVKAELTDHYERIMLIENASIVTMTNCSFDCNTDGANCARISITDTSILQLTGSMFKATLVADDSAYVNIDIDHLWTPFEAEEFYGTFSSFMINDSSNLDLKINTEHHGFYQASEVEFDMWEERVSLVHLVDSNIFNLTGVIKGICWIDGNHCTVNYTNVVAEWGCCKLAAGTGGIQHGVSNTNIITIDGCTLVYDAPYHHLIEDYQSCEWHLLNSTFKHMGASGHNGDAWGSPMEFHKGYEGECGSLEIKNSSVIQYCDTDTGAHGYLRVIGLNIPFDFEDVIIEVTNSDMVEDHQNLIINKPIGFTIEGRMKNVTFINDNPNVKAISVYDSVQYPDDDDPIDENDSFCIEGVINQTQQEDICTNMTRYNLLVSQCPV